MNMNNGRGPAESWKNQARNDKGEFGELLRGELPFDPASIDPTLSHAHARLKAIAEDRYVGATAANAHGIDAERPDDWWDEHSVIAEHRPENRQAYPRIPSKGPGGRLIPRRQYRGAGVHLQMPSAAAIRRFAADSDGSFDVPVSAIMNDRPANAWVRVTPTPGGGFRVNTLGLGGESGTKLAEAVNSVIEARRPTLALSQVDDLVEKARVRSIGRETGAQQRKIESWIESAGYDNETGVSTIVIGGKAYGYRIPKETHDAVYNSTAPGTLFNLMVKPHENKTAVAVKHCRACDRVHLASQPHDCRPFTAPTGRADRGFRKRAVMVLAAKLRIGAKN